MYENNVENATTVVTRSRVLAKHIGLRRVPIKEEAAVNALCSLGVN